MLLPGPPLKCQPRRSLPKGGGLPRSRLGKLGRRVGCRPGRVGWAPRRPKESREARPQDGHLSQRGAGGRERKGERHR
eukprot:7060545-Alexandrium_andersonii.AAC.1